MGDQGGGVDNFNLGEEKEKLRALEESVAEYRALLDFYEGQLDNLRMIREETARTCQRIEECQSALGRASVPSSAAVEATSTSAAVETAPSLAEVKAAPSSATVEATSSLAEVKAEVKAAPSSATVEATSSLATVDTTSSSTEVKAASFSAAALVKTFAAVVNTAPSSSGSTTPVTQRDTTSTTSTSSTGSVVSTEACPFGVHCKDDLCIHEGKKCQKECDRGSTCLLRRTVPCRHQVHCTMGEACNFLHDSKIRCPHRQGCKKKDSCPSTKEYERRKGTGR